MRIFVFIVIGILYSCISLAQPPEDSITMLKRADITANKLAFVNDIDIQHFDAKKISNYSGQSLDNILGDNAGINIKTYGYGGMSNAGMRGGNSNHTAVLWNGVNLQDPLNGSFNLSLFPLFFANDIKVHKGGSSALFGSGAMGGSIHLTNTKDFNKGLQLDILSGISSFSTYQFGTGLKYSNNKLSSILKVFYKTAKNDFPFKNTEIYGNPIIHQENAEQKQIGVLQENVFIVNKHQKLSTAFWYQHNNQNIPKLMSSYSAGASQENESVRAQFAWKYFNKNYSLQIRNSVLLSSLLYNDNISNIRALHHSTSNISEAEYNLKLRKNDNLKIGLINTFEKSNSEDLKTTLDKNPQQNRTAIFTSYKAIFGKKLYAMANIRKEYVKDRFTPLTYSGSINWNFIKTFTVNINASKNYRTPTFNDLFWSDAMANGNPQLQDESSTSEEIGLKWIAKSKIFSLGINAYNSNYNNLIQWVPENGIWTPINKKAVWARGLESSFSINKNMGKFKFSLAGLLVFSKSTIVEKNDNESDEVINKQLILTPQSEWNTNFKVAFKKFSFEYITKYVGARYTTSDNTEYLDSYLIGDIILNKNLFIKDQRIAIMFRLNNIWNTNYVSMPSYAMPLRNYEFSLRLYLNKK
jgi:iron complex outermembrane receptor protein